MRRGVWAITLSLVLVALGASPAAADAVDVRAKQLRRGDYKVRLSAALFLSRSDDPRALSALARAAVKDSRTTIRELAVRSLAKQADESVPSAVRTRVVKALERASRRDRRSKIRRLARRRMGRRLQFATVILRLPGGLGRFPGSRGAVVPPEKDARMRGEGRGGERRIHRLRRLRRRRYESGVSPMHSVEIS